MLELLAVVDALVGAIPLLEFWLAEGEAHLTYRGDDDGGRTAEMEALLETLRILQPKEGDRG